MAQRDATVAIVGAGMSGLFAARELHRQGIDVLVLEAADQLHPFIKPQHQLYTICMYHIKKHHQIDLII